ncbi:MAG: ornithine carbamoyltransferase, partial [Candidatus Poseidoniia archaeon]
KSAKFEGFQINEDLVAHADSDYLFMHCLPAHRGEEVSDAVIDSKNSIVFDQAENRMWAQMSLLTYMCNEEAWQAYHALQ